MSAPRGSLKLPAAIRRMAVALSLSLTAAMAAATAGWAQETPPGPPQGCFLRCKQQYLALEAYDDFTPDSALRDAFGPPAKLARGPRFDLALYRGADVDFVVVKDVRTHKVLGVAVFAPKLPTHARVPYLHMSDESGWRFTLAGNPAEQVLDEEPVAVAGRPGLVWTHSLYFGRPGSYRKFSFLFDRPASGCPATAPHAGSASRAEVCGKGQFPLAAVTVADPGPISAQGLGVVVSRFLDQGTGS